MDPISVTALISGLVAIVTAIGVHFRHSECCMGTCDTRTPVASQSNLNERGGERVVYTPSPSPVVSVSPTPVPTPISTRKESVI